MSGRRTREVKYANLMGGRKITIGGANAWKTEENQYSGSLTFANMKRGVLRPRRTNKPGRRWGTIRCMFRMFPCTYLFTH